jgi:DNA repair protein RadC
MDNTILSPAQRAWMTRRAKTPAAQPAGCIAHENKVIALRECPLPATMQTLDTPDLCADYFRANIANDPRFNPECECAAVLMLNTRRKIKGHYLVATGTMDTLFVHAREVFRVAIISAAHSIVLMHNHPSGDSSPSEADIRMTRDLFRAGQLLKIELLDHMIIGNGQHSSLRSMGWIGGGQ